MTLVQNDHTNTPLPNGMMQWFGSDFDRVEMPDEPILKGEENPVWVWNPPTFAYEWGIADAKLIIEVDDYSMEHEDDCVVAIPKYYRVTLDAPGTSHAETTICKEWHDVQQTCKQAERNLNDNYFLRHSNCDDDPCSWCRGS